MTFLWLIRDAMPFRESMMARCAPVGCWVGGFHKCSCYILSKPGILHKSIQNNLAIKILISWRSKWFLDSGDLNLVRLVWPCPLVRKRLFIKGWQGHLGLRKTHKRLGPTLSGWSFRFIPFFSHRGRAFPTCKASLFLWQTCFHRVLSHASSDCQA